MPFVDLLVRVAGILFTALVAVLAIYLAMRLLGKFVKIVVTVIVAIAVIFAIWFLWSRGLVPDLKSLAPAASSVFSVPFWG